MKKIIKDKFFKVELTKCYDNETNKYYKFKDLKNDKLIDCIIGDYSEDLYEITDVEVEKKSIFPHFPKIK